jgi:hypothetical protein
LAEVARLTGEAPNATAAPGPHLVTALTELDAYLRGELREFSARINWSIMKPFQREAL